jgi:hypothetical protein
MKRKLVKQNTLYDVGCSITTPTPLIKNKKNVAFFVTDQYDATFIFVAQGIPCSIAFSVPPIPIEINCRLGPYF